MTDFSDTSSGLQLLNQASTTMPCNDGNERQIYRQQKKQISHQKSSIEISIDALLGELSDIKAENGIIGDSSEIQGDRQIKPAQMLATQEKLSEVFFQGLEGHSSVYGDEEEA